MEDKLEQMLLMSEGRRSGRTMSVLSYIPSMLAASAMMAAGPFPKQNLGKRRGEYGKPKVLTNTPDHAPGMKAFDIDGVTVYAGSLKAARKKAKLLKYDS